MATAKVSYGTSTDITPSGLQSLANGSGVATAAQSNTTTLAQDYLIEVRIAGTAASTAYLDVYVLTSQGGTNYDTYQSAKYLGKIFLTATPQQTQFSIVSDGSFFECPQNFEIYVVNNTGAALSASGNSIKVTAINTTIA